MCPSAFHVWLIICSCIIQCYIYPCDTLFQCFIWSDLEHRSRWQFCSNVLFIWPDFKYRSTWQFCSNVLLDQTLSTGPHASFVPVFYLTRFRAQIHVTALFHVLCLFWSDWVQVHMQVLFKCFVRSDFEHNSVGVGFAGFLFSCLTNKWQPSLSDVCDTLCVCLSLFKNIYITHFDCLRNVQHYSITPYLKWKYA